MAKVKVHIKINKTIKVFCNGTTADECWQDIIYHDRLDDRLEELYNNANIIEEESIFDDPKENEEEND